MADSPRPDYEKAAREMDEAVPTPSQEENDEAVLKAFAGGVAPTSKSRQARQLEGGASGEYQTRDGTPKRGRPKKAEGVEDGGEEGDKPAE